jgi:hypothetical protein
MKKQRFFCNYELCSDKRILKKKEQILEKKLGAICAGYLKRVTKEILPSWMVAVGISMLDIKMEILLEN